MIPNAIHTDELKMNEIRNDKSATFLSEYGIDAQWQTEYIEKEKKVWTGNRFGQDLLHDVLRKELLPRTWTAVN